ncbi:MULTISPECIES: hypothetical protein [unclassified Streptomyces]|uniref:hypothetical protein n=1 Tax=unclassified Streptomyces TaxID=2593676 RepID=UPI00332980E1
MFPLGLVRAAVVTAVLGCAALAAPAALAAGDPAPALVATATTAPTVTSGDGEDDWTWQR